jgi:glucose-1-phosphate cytidylyltransferase
MVEIGGRPIVWHIMKHYAHFGFNDFYIALGYKGEVIKKYFLDYHALSGDVSISLRDGHVDVNECNAENWNVHLIDTGVDANTGGRILRLKPWLSDGTFMVTYGDGVGDVDLRAQLAFHREQGQLATVTAVRPPARYGGIEFDGDIVARFAEKSQVDVGWINGGFLTLEPEIFSLLRGDASALEVDVLEKLVASRQLAAYRHEGFWQCMDTLRDKRMLNSLWDAGCPPWKVWGNDRGGSTECQLQHGEPLMLRAAG